MNIRKGLIICILLACILPGLALPPYITHASALFSTTKITNSTSNLKLLETYGEYQDITLKITVNASVNLLVTDPKGHSIGYDVGKNSTVNEIPDAVYDGLFKEPQVIEIPNPIGGYQPYKIAATAYEDGPYQASFQTLDSTGAVIDNATRTRIAWTGNTYFFILQLRDGRTISSLTPSQHIGYTSYDQPQTELFSVPESKFASTATLTLVFLMSAFVYVLACNRNRKTRKAI